MINIARRFFRYVGPLRTMLYISIAILSLTALFSMGGTQKTGLMMFPTLIAPAIVPMIFFVLPLDMTMCRIMMSGRDAKARKRYRHMSAFDAAAFAILFVAWFPFYYRLLTL